MDPMLYFTVRGVAQSGSAPVWGTGGRRFESSHPEPKPGMIKRDVIQPSSAQSDARLWSVFGVIGTAYESIDERRRNVPPEPTPDHHRR